MSDVVSSRTSIELVPRKLTRRPEPPEDSRRRVDGWSRARVCLVKGNVADLLPLSGARSVHDEPCTDPDAVPGRR